MALVLTSIQAGRYVADLKRALVEFLGYYLLEDYETVFEHVGGVDVTFKYPDKAPEESLPRPALVVELVRDVTRPTLFNTAYRQHYGEHHEVAVEIIGITDQDTGATVSADDLVAATQIIFALHSDVLEAAGIRLIEKEGGPTTYNPETGLFSVTVTITLDVDVTGRALRTREIELGRFNLNATGQGVFSDGAVLEEAHVLQLKTVTGIGVKPISVTVYGLNQYGSGSYLTGTIPATRGAGTTVALTPATPGNEFTDVTGIEITEDSGLAGEVFVVVNVPKEL